MSTFNNFSNSFASALASRAAAAASTRTTSPTDFLEAADASLLGGGATFTNGTLTVLGDGLDNNLVVSRNAAGQLLVNGGAIPVQGGTPTVANTSLVRMFGLGGNDTLRIDETNGALPAAQLFGGAGDDVAIGGSGNDLVFGGSGNDNLQGKGGTDQLFGGDGDDVLTGGDADDQMFGEAGNDRMIWNPGDDSDLMEGGAGIDTAEVNGGNGAENFTASTNGARVRFDRVDPAPFAIDIGTSENLVLNMNGGDDTFNGSTLQAASIQLTVDGGAGNDTIIGGQGADLLLGGTGNDTITGGRGNDTALMGAGDDRFIWNPGDGSDVVEGQDGNDTMLFNGANIAENITIAANGGRARFFRDVAAVTMDLNDVERIDFTALGGADNISVGDMSGTDVKEVAINLAATGGAGDAAVDRITVQGTNGNDTVQVAGSGGAIAVSGLSATVTATQSEAGDALTLNLLGGNDTVNASGLAAGQTTLVIDAGAGNDTIVGSQGADVILGGDGNDLITGGRGDDLALMGAGDDVFVWNPGDGSDAIEGQAGIDEMLFNGSGASENIDISANGGRVRFFRDVAAVAMDMDDVERITFNALGGADNITVGDLSGTDARLVRVNLAAAPGSRSGDGLQDQVVVNGSAGNDTVQVASVGASVQVDGLTAQLQVNGIDSQLDRLQFNAGAGNDTIDASALAATAMRLVVNAGDGADVIVGSAGNDVINGGRGDDVALMGAGNDEFIWNPGDGSDVIEGQSGVDTMTFNGANVAENIDISANGGRTLFFRNVAAINMDMNDVERIDFAALGGADNIVVRDLSGTDTTEVDIDLAATIGGSAGDGQADLVTVHATNGGDTVTVTQNGSVVSVNGLAATLHVDHFEAALDRVVVTALAGDDIIDASALPAGSIRLTLDGGAGDDVLLASRDGSTLLGGDGDDVLIGSIGNDILDGGAGDDVLIGGGGSDTFIGGEITIDGFRAGAGTADAIDLRAFGASLDFDHLMANLHSIGGDLTLDLGNGKEMTLIGVDASALHADDFLFAAPGFAPVLQADVIGG